MPETLASVISAPERVQRAPILGRLALTFAGVLLGLALVDKSVAAWDSGQRAQQGRGGHSPDEVLGWNNNPHFENPEFGTRLDRFGLRNPEIPPDAPRDELRIAGFGASRIYGAGGAMQAWIWNYQLEELLASEVEPPARVLNGGVMGYSTLQACRRAGLLLDALEPDLVFVCVSPGAQLMLDPSSARHWVRYGDGAGDLIPADVVEGWPRAAIPLIAPIHRFLSAHSGIYRRMRAKFQVGGEQDPLLQRWMLTFQPHSAAIEELIGATLAEARALRDQCAESGTELVVVVLPEIFQCNDQVWEHHLREHQRSGAPPIGTPRREPLDALEQLFAGQGFRTWSFWDEVERMGLDRLRYVVSRTDNHWTRAGHELVARGLAQRLKQSGLLEELAGARRARPRERAFGPSPFDAPDLDPQGAAGAAE